MWTRLLSSLLLSRFTNLPPEMEEKIRKQIDRHQKRIESVIGLDSKIKPIGSFASGSQYPHKFLDRRHGFSFKCRAKCSKNKVGGIKTGEALWKAINDTIATHRKTCNSRYDIIFSYHAAEIGHAFKDVTTAETTTSSTYADISGAQILASAMTANDKWLIVITAHVGASDSQQQLSMRLTHGTTPTAFAESESIIEAHNGTTTRRWTYSCFVVFDQPATAEDVDVQFAVSGSVTGKADNLTMVAINLEADLTENTDWHHDPQLSQSVTLGTDFTTDSNGTVTFTPGTANDEWLVLVCDRINVNSSGHQIEHHIQRSGEASDADPFTSQEGEDTATDFMVLMLARVFQLGASSNTFEAESRQESGGTNGVRTDSQAFALNLSKFDVESESWNTGAVTLDTSSFGNLIDSITIDPGATHDVWIFAQSVIDINTSTNLSMLRLQVENADQPATQTSDELIFRGWDSTDEVIWQIQTIESLTTGNKTIDMDGGSNSGTNSQAEDRTLFAVSMELAAEAANEFVVNYDKPYIPKPPIPYKRTQIFDGALFATGGEPEVSGPSFEPVIYRGRSKKITTKTKIYDVLKTGEQVRTPPSFDSPKKAKEIKSETKVYDQSVVNTGQQVRTPPSFDKPKRAKIIKSKTKVFDESLEHTGGEAEVAGILPRSFIRKLPIPKKARPRITVYDSSVFHPDSVAPEHLPPISFIRSLVYPKRRGKTQVFDESLRHSGEEPRIQESRITKFFRKPSVQRVITRIYDGAIYHQAEPEVRIHQPVIHRIYRLPKRRIPRFIVFDGAIYRAGTIAVIGGTISVVAYVADRDYDSLVGDREFNARVADREYDSSTEVAE